jgi:hypothetical protein
MRSLSYENNLLWESFKVVSMGLYALVTPLIITENIFEIPLKLYLHVMVSHILLDVWMVWNCFLHLYFLISKWENISQS